MKESPKSSTCQWELSSWMSVVGCLFMPKNLSSNSNFAGLTELVCIDNKIIMIKSKHFPTYIVDTRH